MTILSLDDQGHISTRKKIALTTLMVILPPKIQNQTIQSQMRLECLYESDVYNR